MLILSSEARTISPLVADVSPYELKRNNIIKSYLFVCLFIILGITVLGHWDCGFELIRFGDVSLRSVVLARLMQAKALRSSYLTSK
jgi:nitrate reductase NapE component